MPDTGKGSGAASPQVETLWCMPAIASDAGIKQNLLLLLGGNAVFALCQWGILAAIARLGSTEQVGQYALAFALTTPLMLFCNLSLRQILLTDARRSHPFSDYVTVRLWTTAISIVLMCGAALVAGYGARVIGLVVIVGLAKSIESGSDLAYGLQQSLERVKGVALSLWLRGTMGAGAFVLVFAITRDLLAAAGSLAVVWLGVLLACDVSNARRLLGLRDESGSLRDPRRLTRLALPMGLAALLIAANPSLPRLVIENHRGAGELGVFAALMALVAVGSLILNPAGQVLAPRLAVAAAAGDWRAFVRRLGVFGLSALVVGGAGLMVVTAIGPQLLGLLYGPSYAQHSMLLRQLMGIGVLSYFATVLDYGMMARRKFRAMAGLQIVVALVILAGSLALIPSRGLAGAAVAWAISLVVQIVGAAVIVTTGRRTAVSPGRAMP